LNFYTTLLQRYGATPQGVGWPDAEDQQYRFHKLLEHISRAGSLLDWGCGLADLCPLWPGEYIGYDWHPEMRAIARRRQRRARIVDRPELADWVVASGVFNLRCGQKFTLPVLGQMWSYCRRGIAFNMLSARCPHQPHTYLYHDPDETLAFCRRRMSPAAQLYEDSRLDEFVVTVPRPR
jgi:hypothetical protein